MMNEINKVKIKIAVLSSYTIQSIEQPLLIALQDAGFDPVVKFGGYDQYNQELRDVNSFLNVDQVDVIVIALTSNTFFNDLELEFFDSTYADILSKYRSKVKLLLDSIAAYSGNARILVTSFESPQFDSRDLSAYTNNESVASLIHACNVELIEYVKKRTQVTIIDFAKFCRNIGLEKLTDEKMFYLGKMFFTLHASKLFAQLITDYIKPFFGKVKKCLVVDCDNTLWGGVVGEEGASGIKIGLISAVDQIYRDIQIVIRNLKQQGVILVAISKNNLEDGMAAFSNENMILQASDFSCIKMNWEDKSSNLLDVAKELNIGIDSFVFLDDNPAERLEVAAHLPEVQIIDFPKDIAELPKVLRTLTCFNEVALTSEDMRRAQMYRHQSDRVNFKKTVSVGDYLKELDIAIKIERDSVEDIDRIVQLINKTNQFNLRTMRYQKESVLEMMRSDKYVVASAKVADKFGDSGLVAIIILKKTTAAEYFIDTFLMSCRVMGRGIEFRFFKEVLSFIEPNDVQLAGEYIKSLKNSPVKSLLTDLGFEVIEDQGDVIKFSVRCEKLNVKDTQWIRNT